MMSTKAAKPYRDIDIMRTWCLESSLNFTRYMFKHRFKRKFVVGRHHQEISDALDKVLKGEITRLMINIAPRYGKTELAVKNFIAEGLAINPASKFIHLSYSDDLARDNSADVQNIILDPAYQRLFNVNLTSSSTKKWYTDQGGGLYAVSSAGQVTGFGAGLVDDEEDTDDEISEEVTAFDSYLAEIEGFGGAIIIDDPIKPDDALSDTVRAKVNNKFETTIRNRVNSRKTPIIIIMQRLHEDDLCGYLLNLEPEEWIVLSFPCIYTDEKGEEQALWPFKHTLEELRNLEDKSSFVFETQYMQNPRPLEGLLYSVGFKEYEIRPATRKCIRKSYTDTADEGKDFLCSIIYDETEIGNFLVDVLYTQKGMEYTEPETAKLFSMHKVTSAIIESNNGGRGFARAVESQCRILGNNMTSFTWFHQSQNKQVRIFTYSAEVQNITYMPKGWEKMWPQFYKSLSQYMKAGKNKYDDAQDALTGTIEWRGKGEAQDLTGYF
jgi:predicted phage terminase large subunit-like protein